MTKTHPMIVELRTALAMRHVFFASIMFAKTEVHLTDEDGRWRGIPCDTALTDGRNIVFNPKFMGGLELSGRVFVACHEVVHVMGGHPTRFKYYAETGLHGAPFHNPTAQIAADAVINKVLRDAGVGKQPGGVDLTNELQSMGYTLTGQEAWEDVYKVLRDNNFQPDARRSPSGFDTVVDPNPNDVATSELEMKATIKGAAAIAKSRGQLPGGLKHLVDELTEPAVDWREQLRAEVSGFGEPDTYDPSRINKRRYVLPQQVVARRVSRRCGTVVISIDTSGSFSDGEIKASLAEVADILNSVSPTDLYVIWCDAKVDRVDHIDSADELLTLVRAEGVPGRGGTSFVPPFEYIRDHGLDPVFHIYFTDGYGPFPKEDMATCHTIWVMTNETNKGPFGTTIVLKVT